MKTLIVGAGGREHAIAWALRRSNPELEILCAPGNAGIGQLAREVPIAPKDQQALVQFARSEGIEITVVGPEVPLADGLVDEFATQGLRIFGPTRAAARLESSKSFAKDFMSRHRVPTANYRVASSARQALEVLRSGEFGASETPVVIKADGLAAGKGVVVADSRGEGEKAIEDLANTLGVSDQPFLIEEMLIGPEASILIFADGRDYLLMPPARDHKRIGENETGPNTGGMGSITDDSIVDEKTMARIAREIVEPTLEGCVRDGIPFKGVLFFGLMLTADGPKVLEYNVRFGDPETQAILVRLNSDLLEIFQATIDQNLGRINASWSEGASACVVLANHGYPGKFETGAIIRGLPEATAADSVQVFHAGTTQSNEGEFLATGGRVLGVTATGTNLDEAVARCYRAVEKIQWEGMQYRRDIGRFAKRAFTSQG